MMVRVEREVMRNGRNIAALGERLLAGAWGSLGELFDGTAGLGRLNSIFGPLGFL